MTDRHEPAPKGVRPFDLALAALAATIVVYLVVTVPGYRWSRTHESGFLRTLPATVTLAISDPVVAPIARALTPGRFVSISWRGPMPVTVIAVREAHGLVRIELALDAEVDGSGRGFWNGFELRPGQAFEIGDRDRLLSGRLEAVSGLTEVRR